MFKKKNHYDNNILFILLGILLLFIVCTIVSNIVLIIITILAIFVIEYLLLKKFCEFGIYIVDDNVIVKKLGKTTRITANDVKSIVIVKSVYMGKYNSIDLKNSSGKQLYTIILLSDYDLKMNNYRYGDFSFLMEFKEKVLGDCIYDAALIEWLLKKNSSIMLIDNMMR